MIDLDTAFYASIASFKVGLVLGATITAIIGYHITKK